MISKQSQNIVPSARAKIILEIFILYILSVLYPIRAQTLTSTTELQGRGLFSVQIKEVFTSNHIHQYVPDIPPVPLSLYSEKYLKIQRQINQKNTISVLTDSSLSEPSQQTIFDQEEITPYTWKWLDLTLENEEGKTEISIRRPNWWINQHCKHVDRKVFLNMPELNIQGWATVDAIRCSYVDTRLWTDLEKPEGIYRPITGKFKHPSPTIFKLKFKRDNNIIKVTGNHPFWSETQQAWVVASQLKKGEYVKTRIGKQQLKGKKESSNEAPVYNLEVYRDHNYYVGPNEILVHNGCWNWNLDWSLMLKNLENKKLTYNPRGNYNEFQWSSPHQEGPLRMIYKHRVYRKESTEVIREFWAVSEDFAWAAGKNRIIIKADVTGMAYSDIMRIKKLAARNGYTIQGTEKISISDSDTRKFLTISKYKHGLKVVK